MEKTYIIARDGYMHDKPSMKLFKGTFRKLLEDLAGMQDFEPEPLEDGDVQAPWNKPLSEWTDEELEDVFDDANGDGQDYVMVWCVEDKRQVLG